jgi:hypothetical protein
LPSSGGSTLTHSNETFLPLHPAGSNSMSQPAGIPQINLGRHSSHPNHHSSRQRITSLGHPDSGGLGKSQPKLSETNRTCPRLSEVKYFFSPFHQSAGALWFLHIAPILSYLDLSRPILTKNVNCFVPHPPLVIFRHPTIPPSLRSVPYLRSLSLLL